MKAETGAYIGKEVEHRCSKLWSTGDHQRGKEAVRGGGKKKITGANNRQILYICIVFLCRIVFTQYFFSTVQKGNL